MIRAEYLRFLQTLNEGSVTDDERKLANLIIQSLDDLIPLGTHQAQRIRAVVQLAQNNWNDLSAKIQPLPEDLAVDNSPITQLKRLSVGPFRGFSKEEHFDLSSNLVLIYGPNGTGKSSFCEALEYSLLGNVAEAESKRFRDQQSYLRNAYVDSFSAPRLLGINAEGQEIPVVSDDALYRFCFVEKNRIDNFSRIAAQVPAKQTELISTLFGLDSFTEFVRKFTAEIDPRYIDLIGQKATLLAQKRQALDGAKQQLETNNAELVRISTDEKALAINYREGSEFNQVVLELLGCDERVGLISQIESELQQPLPIKSSLILAALDDLGVKIADHLNKVVSIRQELASASQQLSYRNLYDAVTQVQQSSPNNCPACKTPLNQVAVNPFIHSSEELQKLQHLAERQQLLQQLEQTTNQELLLLTQIVNTCCSRFSNNVLSHYQVSPNLQDNIEWWNRLQQPSHDGYTVWQHLRAQVQQLERSDKEVAQATQLRATKQTELNRLREFSRNIIVLQTRRQTASQAIQGAQKIIASFDVDNAQLIADAQAEVASIQRNRAISVAYTRLVTRLNFYKDALPAQLVADLGEKVVQLYNSFNRNDLPSELLAKVHLPLAQNQRLEISFQNKPDQFYDPLHVLSEGHIRCIGLAILLSKNLKENCPVLIFDDPVNAIDDDHRESIRRTLFEDQYFSEKQIILTCHGEEFFKDIHNLLPAQSAAQSLSLAFLPKLDESHIRVDFNCAPRNYIIAAREHFDRNEVREALSKSRKAMESLTKGKVWRYVSKFGDGNLSLKLRGHNAPIELRNLSEQLKAKIDKANFSDPDKSKIFDPLNTLVGMSGESREWRYLNKGTHEEHDRAEFDRNTVATIILALESLDQAL
ncbi:AAA family ATPase [Plesiomonas shigelloides]|uniref:AAA family ATPase n=1 Tax=Plesiomonas shigelloides TaxID=703 RepID=UPI002FCBA0E9